MIFNWVDYVPVTYGEYVFPTWAEGLGWGIASLSLVCIPIGMIKAVYEAKGVTLLKVGYSMLSNLLFFSLMVAVIIFLHRGELETSFSIEDSWMAGSFNIFCAEKISQGDIVQLHPCKKRS